MALATLTLVNAFARGASLVRDATSLVHRVSMVSAASRRALVATRAMVLAIIRQAAVPAHQGSLAFSAWNPVPQELSVAVAWASAAAGMVETASMCLGSVVALEDGPGRTVHDRAPRGNLDQTVSTTVIVTTVPFATLLMANVNASQAMRELDAKICALRVILAKIVTRRAGAKRRTICAIPPWAASVNLGFKEPIVPHQWRQLLQTIQIQVSQWI